MKKSKWLNKTNLESKLYTVLLIVMGLSSLSLGYLFASERQENIILKDRANTLLENRDKTFQNHLSIRRFMAYSYLSQIDEDSTLVVGDSITEGLLSNDFGQCEVVPVGFGSGTLSTVLDFLENLKVEATAQSTDLSHIKSIVILIGVNDSARGQPRTQEYLESWQKSYGKMLDTAINLGVDTVLVSTILPVQEDMPLGTSYFDPDFIDSLNRSIKHIAASKNVDVIDANRRFLGASTEGSNSFTVDGVHLDAKGYQILKSTIAEKLPGCSSVIK